MIPDFALTFEHVAFSYGETKVFTDLTLRVPRQQVTAIMGPSGCGKSTLLSLAAGLAPPQSGQVNVGYQRSAMMFQDPLLLPWRSVLDNVAFALKAYGLKREARLERARHMLDAVNLSADDFGKFPAQLSGGMRQRVALARALVVEPDFLILDEPFTSLDRDLASEMLALVKAHVSEQKMAALVVTHSDEEAEQIADDVVLFSPRPAQIIKHHAP